MNPCQGLPVSPDFLFITIPQERLTKDDSGDSRLINFHALDPVGRYGAFNKRVLPKNLETLWRLAGEQFLLSSCLTEVSEIPGCRSRHGFELPGKASQGHHRVSLPYDALSSLTNIGLVMAFTSSR
jgi:hypothetical protein